MIVLFMFYVNLLSVAATVAKTVFAKIEFGVGVNSLPWRSPA